MTQKKEAKTLIKELQKKTNVFVSISGNNFEERHPILNIRYKDLPTVLRSIARKIEAKTTAISRQLDEILIDLEDEDLKTDL